MAYTQFGKIVRKQMIDHDENLQQLAESLKVTVSFVSAVLTGAKSTPDHWVDAVSDHFDLSENTRRELYGAFCEDKKTVHINVAQLSPIQKQVAVQFQRKLPDLRDEEIKIIRGILEGD